MVEDTCTIRIYDDGQPTVFVNGHLIHGRMPDKDERPLYVLTVPKTRLVTGLAPTITDMNCTAVLPLESFAEWLANGDVGLSSLAIVQRLTGITMTANGTRKNGCEDTPIDPGDISRILAMFDMVPAARAYLSLMSDVSADWETIVRHWSEIEEQYRQEEHNPSGCAPKTYRMLKHLKELELEDCRITTSCYSAP